MYNEYVIQKDSQQTYKIQNFDKTKAGYGYIISCRKYPKGSGIQPDPHKKLS